MVIRLTTGAQVGGALRYNEQKVVQRQAYVLGAAGFANNELAAKNRYYTTSVLESQSRKNGNVKKPTLHFSLSLHPSEQVSDEKFKAMAHQFMDEMGYRNQPYMVYRHHDTAHPHIHIVTTCVDESGVKINDSFIKRRTNAVRQKLEVRFDLIKAQGRGKAPETSQSVEATKAPASDELQRKDRLETILRQTFQQSTFSTIGEFQDLLKKQQVQTTLHQSTTAGRILRGISYQFTDTSGKATTPRIKASEIGAWATWNGVEKQFGKSNQQQQHPNQFDHLSYEQYKVLAALLSEQLRDYKKEQHVYYDSSLIENFPTAAMQARLHGVTRKKLTDEEVNETVRRFEEYKRSQLPEIIKKEQLAFIRTMETYAKIGSEISGSALNKQAYFTALSVSLATDGCICSPSNRHLAYQMDPERLALIQSETGPDLKMPKTYSRGERTVMLLSESKKGFKESYYDVRPEHLERILKPDRMNTIHSQLNENYVTRLIKDGPVIGVDQVRYFYQRGVIIDPQLAMAKEKPGKQTAYKIRFNGAPSQTAVAPGSVFEQQIPHLNLEKWERGLSTEAGRYMVALAQVIDQAKDTNGKSNDITFLRKRIHQRDPALAIFTDEDLVAILEKRSQQGKGWIRQTEQEAKQEPNALLYESASNAQILPIRAADVFGYEQTGKYKHVGKGIKKRSKGREL